MMRWLIIAAVSAAAFAGHAQAIQDSGQVASIDAAIAEADALADRRRWRQAEEQLEAANTTYFALGGDYPLIQARIETGWSDYYRDREHWDDAVDHASRALELTRSGGGDDVAVANAAYDLGYVAYRAGQNRLAANAFNAAVERYADAVPADSARRWRANGWLELAQSAIILYRGDVNEDAQQLNNYRFLNLTEVEDGALGEWLPLEGWAEMMTIGIPFTAHAREIDGFVVLRLQFQDNGRPSNLEIMSSYPGDVFDDAVLSGVRAGRADMSVAQTGVTYALVVTVVQE
ncbi:MAG: hypothetical protein CMF74_17995 [Maricaulis sp.]|jgi:tetratricopeptide (TPR) repeat protein|nr:hypothetical protein [Maricaulis sp.]MAL11540.1 hypothetical protein [Maricaulis sp.]HAQ35773.1 hypothetical protein [Alphaproteobacteria bacterium]